MTTPNTPLSETRLRLLYEFTSKASSSLNLRTLMTHFFNILSKEVEFDVGVFVVLDDEQVEGRTYLRPWVDAVVGKKFAQSVFNRTAELFPVVNADALSRIECSVLQGHNSKDRNVTTGADYDSKTVTELQLKCWGKVCGTLALASPDENTVENKITFVELMTEHLELVIERLFTRQDIERKKLTNILCSMTEGVYLFDANGSFTSINPIGMELIRDMCEFEAECIDHSFSSAEMLSLHTKDCTFAAFLSKVRNLSEQEKTGTFRDEIQNSAGKTLSLTASSLSHDDGWQYGHVITAKDITEERMLQKKMIHSSKLASLGEMAAGIAHEINNPLQSILLNTEILGATLDTAGNKRLERVQEGISRIKAIVKDLLIFAREDTTDTQNVDLNIVIEKATDIMRHQLKLANVNVRLDLEKRPLIVSCNRNLFQQVVINLFQNAKDAIEESGTGSAVSIRSWLSKDKTVAVEVVDDGPGIPKEIQAKIFEPFHTTKVVGKGTGLGLSVSRKIIEGMGGTLTVVSRPEKHTTFRIDIPHKSMVIDERRSNRHREPEYGKLSNLAVLMVDDEQEVLHSVCDSISSYVGSIETSNDSIKAYGRIKERDYDLLLLDIRMPGMDGTELYDKVIKLKPTLADKVLFLSGDIEGEKTAKFLRECPCKYLPKPFSSKELLMIMCEMASKPKQRQKESATVKGAGLNG